MLRRFALVPLAALGVATAFLVSGAGSAVTSLVRIQPAGVQPDGTLRDLAMTDDGACLVGETTATNDVGTDNNGGSSDIVLFQRASGTWTRITNGNSHSVDPSISDDCNLIVFLTNATDILTADTNGTPDVVVFNRSASTYGRVTPNASSPEVSGNGQFVAFRDGFSNHILRLPVTGGSPVQVSVSSAGVLGDGLSSGPSISDDGNLIAFMSHSTNLVAGDTNGKPDIFLRNVSASTTELVSQKPSGGFAPAPGSGFGGSLIPDISGNGRYVAFDTDMPGITGGNFGPVAVLRDRQSGANALLAGNDGALDVNDAGLVAVATYEGFDPADSGFDPDIYVINGVTVAAEWVSQKAGGGPPTGGFYPFVGSALVSEDGGIVAFTSTRTNLIAGDTNNCEDGFLVLLGAGGGSMTTTTVAPTTTTTPTTTMTTTTTTTTTVDVTPPTVELPGRADLVVTKTASEPASGESFAPGESITYTVEVVNAGTRTAVNVHVDDDVKALQLGSAAPKVAMAVTAPDCSVSPGPGGGPVVASATLDCPLGDIPPRGGRRTVTYSVSVTGDKIPLDVTNRASTSYATNDADESDNVDETTVHMDTGDRDCAAEGSCESGPGTTTTTCAGADTVCKYGGEGVMNTTCSDDAVCGGGPLAELKICTDGATCKDRVGEPNVFRCSGEETYCAGVGIFTCSDGARCVANGESTGTCRDASCSWGANDNKGVMCIESACWTNDGDDTVSCTAGSTCYAGAGSDRLTCRSSSCWAGAGRDVVICDTGTCGGGPGADTLLGGKRSDVLVGGTGPDKVIAGAGDDFTHTRDGEKDDVKCGPGEDHAETDSLDLHTTCERVPRMDLELVEIDLRDAPRFTSLTGIAEYPVNTPFEVRFTVVNHGPSPTEAHLTWTLLNRLGGEAYEGILFFANDKVDRFAASECTYDPSGSGVARCPIGSIGPGETRVVRLWISLPHSLPFSHFAWVSDVAGAECRPATDDDCGNNRKDGAPFGTFDPSKRPIDLKPPKPPPPVGPDLEVTIRGTTESRPDRTLRYDVIVRNIGSRGIDLNWLGILFDKAWHGDNDESLDYFLIAPQFIQDIETLPPNRRIRGAFGRFTTEGGQCEAVKTPQYDENSGNRSGSFHAGAICRWIDTFLSPGEQRVVHVEAQGGTISNDSKSQREALPERLQPYWRQHIDPLYFALQAHTAHPVGLGELRSDNNWAVLTTQVSPGASPYTPPAQRPSWRDRWRKRDLGG